MQKCIYLHEGALNKLLMDDKGSTLIVVFGFPPLSHQDDPTRACLTAFTLVKEIEKLDKIERMQEKERMERQDKKEDTEKRKTVGINIKIGIATGIVFAGVVGTSGSRREYSVLGDSVNLSARLMQLACTNKEGKKIFCCQNTAQ